MDNKRIRELERSERILNALVGAGVDNWEGYEFALEDIEKEDARIEKIEDLVESILEIAGSNADVEPAGRGTGVGFHAEAEEQIFDLIEKAWRNEE